MIRLLELLLLIGVALASRPAIADDAIHTSIEDSGWRLENTDRVYMISMQADTMALMTFRIGTIDQLQTVQSLGGGYSADAYADFAPTRWLQLGATINYGTIGDPALQNIIAPTVYAKAQFLRQETSGVNMAAGVNLKKIGFQSPDTVHPNDGEIEGQVFLDKRIGNVFLTANAVFGKSFSVPDSDAEVKLSGGYLLRRNLLVGVDSITRYDTSFDGGPKDGTRYWEFTGGAIASWKVARLLFSGLVGIAAPFHTPAPGVGGAGVGPVGMLQVGYGFE
jgi:hypothetical protein